jgi:hypothetical protein
VGVNKDMQIGENRNFGRNTSRPLRPPQNPTFTDQETSAAALCVQRLMNNSFSDLGLSIPGNNIKV